MRMRSVIQMKVILATWATQHRLGSGAICTGQRQQPVRYLHSRDFKGYTVCTEMSLRIFPISPSVPLHSHEQGMLQSLGSRNRYVFLNPIGSHWQAPIIPCERAFKYLFTDIHRSIRGSRDHNINIGGPISLN